MNVFRTTFLKKYIILVIEVDRTYIYSVKRRIQKNIFYYLLHFFKVIFFFLKKNFNSKLPDTADTDPSSPRGYWILCQKFLTQDPTQT